MSSTAIALLTNERCLQQCKFLRWTGIPLMTMTLSIRGSVHVAVPNWSLALSLLSDKIMIIRLEKHISVCLCAEPWLIHTFKLYALFQKPCHDKRFFLNGKGDTSHRTMFGPQSTWQSRCGSFHLQTYILAADFADSLKSLIGGLCVCCALCGIFAHI